ncbi:hypothetical protein BSU04_40460 [Caballeronia sordidicola]|uniref:Uncharacterized protein n=1 Tax=Caballeronia sordidicola TaxID=196367 RepID=A0A226WNC4_CABSO|nr:hypothetical protein BSU04_40460 [Caballeronia sordidicola]
MQLQNDEISVFQLVWRCPPHVSAQGLQAADAYLPLGQ